MELKTGAAESTLDDKGRVNIPTRFREYFQGKLFITRGMDKCAMIMTESACEKFYQAEGNSELNQEEREALKNNYLRLINEVELDKTGRIAIPSHIRKYANLTKNCLVIRDDHRIFIWDLDAFDAHLEETNDLAKTAMNKLGSHDIFKVG